ncbi:MAG: carbohydrate kinase family protein, partial [Blautia sp.]|nr:carbohydrate kinase family protein [Blautia sp.]
KTGDDAFGKMIRQILAQYGVDGLVVDADSSTSYSVVLAIPGTDRVFLHNPGANDTFSGRDVRDEELEDAVLFHFGYPPLMKKMYEDQGEELRNLFRRVKEKGIATSLDLAAIDPDSDAGKADWSLILERVLPFVDFFLPSFEELCFMLNRERYDQLRESGEDMAEVLDMEKDVRPLADQLIRMGCKVVLIKCGTSGMYFQTGGRDAIRQIGERLGLDIRLWTEKHGIQPIFQADQVLSGTGAGDTSIAAFLTAVLQGEEPEMCVALAAAEGACCVTAYDALSGLKPLEELKAWIKTG